ncbi:MAG: type VI secretion system contractile sheath small subunit [Alphaproteobacteria bacterium]|nr:type VI secretion system contractile sheath small subunit [Alphaproteobacteria bacterium]
MTESTQHKLDRVRPPRVQITYDVEIGNAIEKKELPFIVGIMADLSGKPEKALPKVKDRKFVEIDRDNFNDVLAAIRPRLAFQVNNALAGDGSKLNCELKFSNMEDFDAVNVLKQIEPMRKLYEARQKLSDLLTKLDGNDELDQLLSGVIASTDNQKKLKDDLGAGADKPAEDKPAG